MPPALAAIMTFGAFVFVAYQQMAQRAGRTYGMKRIPGKKALPTREKTTVVVPGQDDFEIDLPDVGGDEPGSGPSKGPAITPGSCLSRHSNIYARTPVALDPSIDLPKLPSDTTVRVNLTASAQRELADAIEQLNTVSPTAPAIQARRALDGMIGEECFMRDVDDLTAAEATLLIQARFIADGIWLRDGKPPIQYAANENFISRSQLGMPPIGALNLDNNQIIELLVKGDSPYSEEHIFARAMYRFDQDTYMVEVIENDMLGEDVAPRLSDAHGFDVGDQLMVADSDPTAVYRVYPQKSFPVLDQATTLANNVLLFDIPFTNDAESAYEARVIDTGYTRSVLVITDSRRPEFSNLRQQILQNAMMNPSTYYGIVDCAADQSLCNQVNAVYINKYSPQGQRLDDRNYQNLQFSTVPSVINQLK